MNASLNNRKQSLSYPTFKTHFKNGDSYQVMTQAIRQEPLLTTLHPLPAGSTIMGGQGKRSVHHKGLRTRGSPRDRTVSDQRLGFLMPSHIPGNIPLISTKNLEYL
jgi:hypothetical protein